MKPISARDIVRSAGIIPLRKVGNEYLILMLRSYSFWECGPKGRVDGDEDFFEAAIREAKEEASFKPSDLIFKWGKEGYTTEAFKKGTKTVTYFVAETTKKDIKLPINPELGHAEHEEYRWCKRDEAKRLANARIGKAIDWAYNKAQLK